MDTELERLKKNKSFRDFTGDLCGDIKVLSFKEKLPKHPIWNVECTQCGKVYTMQSTHLKNKVKGMGCGTGCTARVNKVVHKAEGITLVDVSTPRFPNKTCIVDTEMYHKYMTNNRWYCYSPPHSKNFYVFAKIATKRVALHRLLLGTPDHLVTDHENGNGLDNRRANLRAVTHTENMKNLTKHTGTLSGYTGLNLRPSGKYQVYIRADGKRKSIGTYELEEALLVRAEQEKIHGYHENHGRVRVQD